MTFAPQRPQSIYGRTQIPGSQINWDMATQPGKSIGGALASIGAVAGEAMKADKLRQQKATKLRSALSSYADDLGLSTGDIAGMSLDDMEGHIMGQQLKGNLLQQEAQAQAQQLAAKKLAAWDEDRAQETRKTKAEIDASVARTAFYGEQQTDVKEEREAAKKFNEAIDLKVLDGGVALTDMANWIAAAPQGQRTRDQYEAQNPDKVMLMRLAEDEEGKAWGDPGINVTQEQFSDWTVRHTDDKQVTIAGKPWVRTPQGKLIQLTKGATTQKTGDQVKDELAYAAVAAGDYTEEMSGEGLWQKAQVADDETEGDTWILADVPGLKTQTTYRVAEKTLTQLPSHSHDTFKSAFVTKQKGVRLTRVDQQLFDLDGDKQLDAGEERSAKKIRSRQAVETLQQIGHAMWKHEDPTAPHPEYPAGHAREGQKRYNVPHAIHPEDQTIVGTRRRDREQWFHAMGIKDPYKWDKTVTATSADVKADPRLTVGDVIGGWVIAQRITASSSVNIPFLGTKKVTGAARSMTEAEFFQLTHPQSQVMVPGSNVPFVKAFPPVR